MTNETKKRKGLLLLLDVIMLAGVLAIGLLIRFAVYESAIVTSGSMQNTIAISDRVLVDHRASLSGHWKRGDIVMFEAPETWGGDDEALVKRVIGLPGETVEVREGAILINGSKLPESYLREPPEANFMQAVTLKSDEYFLCGDNRNNSDDSRENGPVPNKFIRGRVVMRLAPLNGMGRFVRPIYEGF